MIIVIGMKMSYITAACRAITLRSKSRKPKPTGNSGAAGDRLEQFFGSACQLLQIIVKSLAS